MRHDFRLHSSTADRLTSQPPAGLFRPGSRFLAQAARIALGVTPARRAACSDRSHESGWPDGCTSSLLPLMAAGLRGLAEATSRSFGRLAATSGTAWTTRAASIASCTSGVAAEPFRSSPLRAAASISRATTPTSASSSCRPTSGPPATAGLLEFRHGGLLDYPGSADLLAAQTATLDPAADRQRHDLQPPRGCRSRDQRRRYSHVHMVPAAVAVSGEPLSTVPAKADARVQAARIWRLPTPACKDPRAQAVTISRAQRSNGMSPYSTALSGP